MKGLALLLASATFPATALTTQPASSIETARATPSPHPHVGMWVTADGECIDGVLHHAGMVLLRENARSCMPANGPLSK